MASVAVEKLYSFEDYLAYDDGTDPRFELVDGQLEPMNPPKFRHLLMAKFIEQQLDAEIERSGQPLLCLREAGICTGWQKSRLTDVCNRSRSSVRYSGFQSYRGHPVLLRSFSKFKLGN